MLIESRKFLPIMALFLLSTTTNVFASQNKQLAEGPANQLASFYNSLKLYRDTGILEVIYYENGKSKKHKVLEFSTHYEKSGDFEIAWNEKLLGDYFNRK